MAEVFFFGSYSATYLQLNTYFLWKNTFLQRLLTTMKYVLVFYFNLLPGSLLAVKIAAVEM